MNRLLSEQETKEMLGIDDFRQMTKEKTIVLASKLSDMQPEVAMKALEQFPDFSKTIIELATEYKASIDKGLEGNSESMKAYSNMLQTIIDTCKANSEKDNISFEEKKYYLDKMFEAAELQKQKDSENKEFIGKVLQLAALSTIVLGSIALVALGGKADFKLPIKKT